VRWVVRIVTTVRQTVSEKLYTRTDVSQLRTLSVARFPRTPVTANTNSTPKANTLNYMQFVRARNTLTTQSVGVARSNYSQQAALLQKQTRRNRRTPIRHVLCKARGKSEANTKFQVGGVEGENQLRSPRTQGGNINMEIERGKAVRAEFSTSCRRTGKMEVGSKHC